MKQLLKKSAAFLATLLLFLFPLSAYANSTYTITIENKTAGHTYEAYQVFSGRVDLLSNGNQTLSDIEWGSGVNGSALQNELKSIREFSSITSAQSAAKVLENQNSTALTQKFVETAARHLTSAAGTSVFTGSAYTISNLAPGYYLIKDKDGSVPAHESFTEYLLKVVGNVSVAPKSSVAKMIKKVKENNRGTPWDPDPSMPGMGIHIQYTDTADYNIGDEIPYKLYATLPANYDKYSTFALTFEDTCTDALENTGTYSVTAITKNNNQINLTSSFRMETSTSGKDTTTRYICDDIKKAGAPVDTVRIELDYTSILTPNAIIGAPGNYNHCRMIFSNNPNKGHESDRGSTPVDTNVVFTYGIDIQKVDADDVSQLLPGAQFVLQNESGNYALLNAQNRIIGWTAAENDATRVTTNDKGSLSIEGLDDGHYTLTEVAAPAGYNIHPQPVTLEIDAELYHPQNFDGNPNNISNILAGVTVIANGVNSVNNDTEHNTLITITNTKGSVLPETGGNGSGMMVIFGLGAAALGVLYFMSHKKHAVKS